MDREEKRKRDAQKKRWVLTLKLPRPPTGSFGPPWGPKCPGECLTECLRQSGCPRWCPEECVGGLTGPWSVKRVSWTLWGHSRDTFWALWSPEPEGPPTQSPGHSLGHPDFRGHSVGHFPGHFGPEGPEASCKGSGMSQF